MPLEFLPLLMVFFFPFLYKLGYWGSVFEKQNYGFHRSGEYLLSKKGFPKIFHFWIFIEAPLFSLSFIIFFNPLFEIFLFNLTFYFLLLYNIFVFGKIIRGKFYFPEVSKMFILTFVFIFIVGIGSLYFQEKLIYTFITGTIFLMPFYFLLIEGTKKILVKAYK